MKIKALLGGVALALAVFSAVRADGPDTSVRHYDLHWTIRVDQAPEGAKEARVWIAVPQTLPEQQVSDLKIETAWPWKLVEDPTFHNQVALVRIPSPPASFSIELSARVVRRPVEGPQAARLSAEQRALYLRPEALVSLSPRLQTLADSVGGTSRTRFDYVRTRMVYDKSVPGWGNGDSERACSVGRGNCTDFHSLFMSLSRVEKVPARFEMGYATLPGGETNHAGGYHCWAWFYDEGAKAWVPVDISEANQHPEQAQFLYGHLDSDRITFSRGRDVLLPGMAGKPLNYLPAGAYVEVDGRKLGSVTRVISYTVDGSTAEKGN